MSRTYKHDITGMKFGRWTALEFVPSDCEYSEWLCKCDCGNTKIIKRVFALGSKSCGCLRRDHITSSNISRVKNPQDVMITYMASRTRNGAKIRGIEFDLTKDDVAKLILGRCHYCGKSMCDRFTTKRKNSNRVDCWHVGIDRVDNSIGYISSNCVPCCSRCNSAKSTLNVVEFTNWAARVYKYCIEGKNES